MPYKSDQQRKFFHAAEERGEISPKVVHEWDEASKGKKLPKFARVHKMCMGGKTGYADGGMIPGQGEQQPGVPSHMPSDKAYEATPMKQSEMLMKLMAMSNDIDSHQEGYGNSVTDQEVYNKGGMVTNLTAPKGGSGPQNQSGLNGQGYAHGGMVGDNDLSSWISEGEKYSKGGVVDNQHFADWVNKPAEGYAMGGAIMPPVAQMPPEIQQRMMQQGMQAQQGMAPQRNFKNMQNLLQPKQKGKK
jgi:hypothetical protein